MLPFIIIGLTVGAVYGLAAVGLVLTYRTTGIFNLALGALATVSAYVVYSLFVERGWPWQWAVLVAVCVVGPIMGLLLELVARGLQGKSLIMRLGATVGILLVIEGVLALWYPSTESRNVPVFLGTQDFQIGGTAVQMSQIVTFVFALAVTAGLSLFLRRSRRGLAMRAVVDNPDLLDLAGTNPTSTRRWAWIIGGVLAAASGVLFAPLLPLEPAKLTLLVVAAFGAAAIGGFVSLPLTFAGGLVIGVLSSLATKWFGTGMLAGLAPSLPFIVLFVVLLVFPKRRLLGKTFSVAQSRPTWAAPGSVHLISGAIGIVFLIYVPYFAGIHLTDWTTGLALTVVFLGLGMLVRTSGQVSLCHVGFMAIGAATFSHLSVGAGLPWLVALLLAGLVTVPIGALLAIPAIRLSGLYLALATLGFGLLLQSMFYTQDYMFGDSNAGLEMPRPELFGMSFVSDINFYYLALGLSIVAALVTVVLHRGRLGRLLRGLSDSPTALETSGASVTVTKVIVFCLSAFFAAIGGALAGMSQGSISASSYSPLLSLTFFALILICVGSEPWYAILAGFGWAVLPSYVSGENVDTILQVIFGLSAILIAVTAKSGNTVPAVVRRAVDTVFGQLTLDSLLRRTATPPPSTSITPVQPGVLQVEQMTITFGGVTAVDALTLTARTGTVTGLIGPNGAGKTTTFNGCTGLLRPTSGHVILNDRNVTGRGPATRAQLGLGRTFQKMELFESLSVRENVAIGAEGSRAGFNPLRHLLSTRAANNAITASTDEALRLCGIEHLADDSIAALSTGHRRLVELARCLAGPFQILLLDEPSSGLDAAETKRFGDVLKSVVAQRQVGILLVEHDMSLVLDICDDIYVLDFGELIFTGTPTDITTSPIVQAAYLGDDLPAAATQSPQPSALAVEENA